MNTYFYCVRYTVSCLGSGVECYKDGTYFTDEQGSGVYSSLKAKLEKELKEELKEEIEKNLELGDIILLSLSKL